MRTADDVRDAFVAFADRAPTEVQVIVAEPTAPPRSWRPVVAACVAVTAVVAAVAALAVVLAPGRNAAPAGAPPAPVSLRFTIDVPGYRVVPIRLNRDYQEASVSRGSQDAGTVLVFAPGAFAPSLMQHLTRQSDVHGSPAYLGTLNDNVTGGLTPGTNQLIWLYAPNAWALLEAHQPNAVDVPAAQQLMLARAMRLSGAVTPLKVPFRLGYLPPGLVPTSGTSLGSDRSIGFSDAATADNSPYGPWETVLVSVSGQGSCSGGSRQVAVHGYRACFQPNIEYGYHHTLKVEVPGGWLTVDSYAKTYSDAVLRKIADSVTLATINRPSTWFDAETALPH